MRLATRKIISDFVSKHVIGPQVIGDFHVIIRKKLSRTILFVWTTSSRCHRSAHVTNICAAFIHLVLSPFKEDYKMVTDSPQNTLEIEIKISRNKKSSEKMTNETKNIGTVFNKAGATATHTPGFATQRNKETETASTSFSADNSAKKDAASEHTSAGIGTAKHEETIADQYAEVCTKTVISYGSLRSVA